MAPSISLPSLLVVTPTIRLGLRGGTGRFIDFNFVLATEMGVVVAGLVDAEKIIFLKTKMFVLTIKSEYSAQFTYKPDN